MGALTIAVVNSKGGSNKSNLVLSCDHVLTKILHKRVAVYNLDPQDTVHDRMIEDPEIILVDTIGAFAKSVTDLLRTMSTDDNSLVIVPVSTGRSDRGQYDFLIEKLKENNVFDKSIFVFTKVNVRANALSECRKELKDKGCTVAKSYIPMLECFAQWQWENYKVVNHVSRLLHEIVIPKLK